jgi:hypothetical protein
MALRRHIQIPVSTKTFISVVKAVKTRKMDCVVKCSTKQNRKNRAKQSFALKLILFTLKKNGFANNL